LRRSERIAVLAKYLNDYPSRLFSLSFFVELLGVAKSTVSEDLSLIRESWRSKGLGDLVTVPGASGGVKYVPCLSEEAIDRLLKDLAGQLADSHRILPGGFIYMSDIIGDPVITEQVGQIFANLFSETQADYVVTIATKGIPLAIATARALNLTTVIIRNDNKVTEGSSVSLNYITSSRTIRTMSLSRRALKEGARVLFIDDFMKAGSTAQGVVKLVKEFGAEVVGTGFLVTTAQPEEKMITDYHALLTLEKVDEALAQVVINPAPKKQVK
jgi:purine operon repressor